MRSSGAPLRSRLSRSWASTRSSPQSSAWSTAVVAFWHLEHAHRQRIYTRSKVLRSPCEWWVRTLWGLSVKKTTPSRIALRGQERRWDRLEPVPSTPYIIHTTRTALRRGSRCTLCSTQYSSGRLSCPCTSRLRDRVQASGPSLKSSSAATRGGRGGKVRFCSMPLKSAAPQEVEAWAPKSD